MAADLSLKKAAPIPIAFHAMVIDRSPRGLQTAQAFELRFPGMRQSMAKWHETGFQFLILGVITESHEQTLTEYTLVWAKDFEDLAHKAVPTLMLSLAERSLVPEFTLVVDPAIQGRVAGLLRPADLAQH